jgi:hypothetical protein
MNATILLENTLLQNGMNVGKTEPRNDQQTLAPFLSKPLPQNDREKKKRALLAPILSMIALILVISAPLDESWVYRGLDKLMLIPREEPYTALYFEYYDDLPKQAAAGEMINFTFTIKNSEGYDKEYDYAVYLKKKNNREKIPVADGTVTVKNGESSTVSQSYVIAQTFEEAALFVELPESGQNIHFILKN